LVRRLVLLAFVWGWSFLFIKVSVAGMTPTTVAFSRIALGALALHGYLRFRGVTLPRNRTFWRHAAVCALFANILPFTMLAWGEERITSALTAVLNASTPLFTALAAFLYLQRRLGKVEVAGLLVGLAGVGVAAGVGGSDLAESSLAGSLAAILAGACYGIGLTYTSRHQLDVPAEIAAAGQLTVGALAMLPVALATTVTDGIDLAPHRVLAIVLLGAVGTGVAYLLYYRSVADLGPTTTSLVTYLVPVVAVAVGVVVLDEQFHARMLLGGLMIVAGILLVQRRFRLPGRRAQVPAATGG
jgi:drug/metabolite transporter (DMT)-like permease